MMTITRARLMTWLRQPTTISGLAALSGDLLSVALGATTWRIELPLAVGSFVAIALPDNSAAIALAARTIREGLEAAATRNPQAIADAIADAERTVAALAGASPHHA
jgi:hypothetical protein